MFCVALLKLCTIIGPIIIQIFKHWTKEKRSETHTLWTRLRIGWKFACLVGLRVGRMLKLCILVALALGSFSSTCLLPGPDHCPAKFYLFTNKPVMKKWAVRCLLPGPVHCPISSSACASPGLQNLFYLHVRCLLPGPDHCPMYVLLSTWQPRPAKFILPKLVKAWAAHLGTKHIE